MITGLTTNKEGAFSFKDLEAGNYIIKASFIGYASQLVKANLERDLQLAAIVLKEEAEELEEVSVTVKKPSIERKVDRLVFNVEGTTLSSGSSWDILSKTPGVVVKQDNLLVRGESTTIYLNDRKVQISSAELKSLLEGLSGDNVGTVEVIFNPPARYDAEGGPILNINTTKNVSLGYKGSVNAAYVQAIAPKYTWGFSQFYKTKKLNLFLNYNNRIRKEVKRDNQRVSFLDNNNAVFNKWNADFERITKSRSHNIAANLDYEIDARNSIGFATNLLATPNKTFDNQIVTNAFNASNQLDSTFINKSDLNTDLNNVGFDLSYKHKLKKAGAVLSSNLHYTKYTQDRIQNSSTDYFDNTGAMMRNVSFFTDAAQDISIYTGQLDFETPLGDTSFETGVKYSGIASENGLAFSDIAGNTSTPNAANSDNFLYDENVFAVYASMSKDWEKWSLKVGLRGEQTESTGTSLNLNTVNSLNYFELFPTFYLSNQINDNNSISFDYSRRLKRPRYEDLNPFAYYLNENNFDIGNPNLLPSFAHRFTFNYTLEHTYSFELYYRDNGSNISTLGYQNNDNLSLLTRKQNVVSSASYGIDLSMSKSLSNAWYMYAYVSLFHEDETFVAEQSNNALYTNEIEGVYIDIYNGFTLSKDGSFNGDLSFNYITGFISGSYQQEAQTSLSIGLNKSLWNNRMVVHLIAQDLLGKVNARYNSNYLNQNNSFISVPETQFVQLGFKYNFGNFRLGDNQRSIDKIERERL
jgi:hypothetical protein